MDSSLTHDEIISKQKEIAKKHKDVQTCYRWNFSEFDGPVRDNTVFPLMTIESPTLQFTNTESSLFSGYNGAFNILGMDGVYTNDVSDEEAINKVLNNSLEIALEVCKKLIEIDGVYMLETGIKNKWYSSIDKLSFQLTQIGPVTSNYLYGYRCEFKISTPFSTKLNPDKWQ
ncbi:hypothetical protein SAMN04489761_3079 [Tenacibaculum sp. MAR_2009_124]|uniref:hypothetical protein n=1 Tax=Tenacibaculum sp. MAR_2009_124 TaxID=1250059 RepID=UPI00089907B1|nr:hypothetical protein [Tenacibaculum sp. MAR_2009_124]SEC46910.1 hypothetical protein SAMN04489761_3079 [Tenacibaculum sp. MAR_2009_124]